MIDGPLSPPRRDVDMILDDSFDDSSSRLTSILLPTGKDRRPRPASQIILSPTFLDSPYSMSSSQVSASMPSMLRRHSMTPITARRPLRSSPLAGPAFSSEGLLIKDEDVKGKAKPSRISSTPDLPSLSFPSSDYPAVPVPPLPTTSTSQFGTFPDKPKFSKRKSSPPGLLSTPSAKSPSTPSPPLPPTPPSKSSRPPSRESTKSLPSPSLPRPPNFPHALHRNSMTSSGSGADWLTRNTYGEVPRFSRLSMGSNVVMPVSAKELRRRSPAASKSNASLRNHASSAASSATRRSMDSNAAKRDSERDNGTPAPAKEPSTKTNVKSVNSNSPPSSLMSKVRRRTSIVGTFISLSGSSDSSETQSMTSVPSLTLSRSRSECSSVTRDDDDSDVESFIACPPPPPPRAPSSAHSRRSSLSDCGVIDEEAEDDAGSPTAPKPPAQLGAEESRNLADISNISSHNEAGATSKLHASASVSSAKSRAEDFTGRSRNSSFGSIASLTKKTIQRTRSRTSSNADPVLNAASGKAAPQRKHHKGMSFLSFTSSEDAHDTAHDTSHIPPVPTIPDQFSSHSHDSLPSSDSAHVYDRSAAEQLLFDALPRTVTSSPVSLKPVISPASMSNRRSSLTKLKADKARRLFGLSSTGSSIIDIPPSPTPPPAVMLPSPPSSSSSGSPVSQNSPTTPTSIVIPSIGLTPPSPTRARSRIGQSDKAMQTLGPGATQNVDVGGGAGVRPYASSSNFDLPTSPSGRPQSLSRAGSAKAMSLLGVNDPGLSMVKNKSDSNLDKSLEFGGKPGGSGGPQRNGTVKRIWKTLMGGKVKVR